MPISTNVLRAQVYVERKHILFDTSAFIWFAKSDETMGSFRDVLATYRVLAPTPVMYELTFGSGEQADKNQTQMWQEMHDLNRCLDLTGYHFASVLDSIPKTGLVVLNPGFNEWWTARMRLLDHVASTVGATARHAKREYSIDALIHATARNCFAPVCTTNLVDFDRLNRVTLQRREDGPVPIFRPEEVIRSLTETVHFETP